MMSSAKIAFKHYAEATIRDRMLEGMKQFCSRGELQSDIKFYVQSQGDKGKRIAPVGDDGSASEDESDGASSLMSSSEGDWITE